MRLRAQLVALALALGSLATPGATSADGDVEYPVYDVTSVPAHGVTIEQRDCSGQPTTQGPAPYRFVWDATHRQDVLELSAHSGKTSVGIDVADTSRFEFWEFGNHNVGTVEVVVDLGDEGLLRGTGAMSFSPDTRGGTYFISKATVLDWTQFSQTHPHGLDRGPHSIDSLPAGLTGPARVSLTLSDCPGSTAGTRLRLGSWWLDAGPGAQWMANLATNHQPRLTGTVSRTRVTSPASIVLSVAVSDLPAGEKAELQLWRKVRYSPNGVYYTPPTWRQIRSIPVRRDGRTSVTVTPTENTSYMWELVATGNGIATARTAPAAVTVAPHMTLTLDRRSVPQGQPVTVSGSVDGHRKATVTLYRQVGSRLVKIKTAPGGGVVGDYSFTFTPRKSGTWKLVTMKAATTEFTAGTSRTATLRVR